MHFCVESVLQGISPFNAEDKTGTCEKPNSNSVERPLGADVWLYESLSQTVSAGVGKRSRLGVQNLALQRGRWAFIQEEWRGQKCKGSVECRVWRR